MNILPDLWKTVQVFSVLELGSFFVFGFLVPFQKLSGDSLSNRIRIFFKKVFEFEKLKSFFTQNNGWHPCCCWRRENRVRCS